MSLLLNQVKHIDTLGITQKPGCSPKSERLDLRGGTKAPKAEIGKTATSWMPETLEYEPNGGARSTCDPPIRVSSEPLLSMEWGELL